MAALSFPQPCPLSPIRTLSFWLLFTYSHSLCAGGVGRWSLLGRHCSLIRCSSSNYTSGGSCTQLSSAVTPVSSVAHLTAPCGSQATQNHQKWSDHAITWFKKKNHSKFSFLCPLLVCVCVPCHTWGGSEDNFVEMVLFSVRLYMGSGDQT